MSLVNPDFYQSQFTYKPPVFFNEIEHTLPKVAISKSTSGFPKKGTIQKKMYSSPKGPPVHFNRDGEPSLIGGFRHHHIDSNEHNLIGPQGSTITKTENVTTESVQGITSPAKAGLLLGSGAYILLKFLL